MARIRTISISFYFADKGMAALALATIISLTVGAASAQTALDRVIADYQQECVSAQADILPEMDADLDPPQAIVLKIDDDAIYEIKVTPEGKLATVVFTSFSCTNIGYAWCGSGGCVSYLIVDEHVFEWEGGGRPMSVDAGERTLIVSPVSGFCCTDSEGREGWGASPCYRMIIWDEELRTFWSERADIKVRPNLSARQIDEQN
jgi:hypothetical protein